MTATALSLHTVTPYLIVTDARAALEFYVSAFGAARRGEPIVMPDGKVGHVEFALGDSVIMMADEFPDLGLLAPPTRGGATQSMHFEAADPDGVVDRAVALGATLERPVTDSPYGRMGVVVDPAGHRWMVSRSPATARPGDPVFASLQVPDAAVAERFYADALGVTPNVHGGQTELTLVVNYTVPDIRAAVARVRAAGGTATEPDERPYGWVSDVRDDQGLLLALHESATPPPRIDVPTTIELRLPDLARARAFYATVLGWRFEPTDDGWTAIRSDGSPPSPAIRLTQGAALVVPGFQVADTDAAASAIRTAGGTVGATHCTDNQGVEFTLK